MNKATRNLLDRVNKFFYGDISYNEDDLAFILRLEDRIINLGESETLYFYLDYEAKGNINDMIHDFEKEIGRGIHAGTMINKRGIKITRHFDAYYVEIKDGYGKNWETFTYNI